MSWWHPAHVGHAVRSKLADVGQGARLFVQLLRLLGAALRRPQLVGDQIHFLGNYSLSIIAVFMERMAVYDLKVVDFSVLSLVAHNPGITSRQLCATLSVLPPNMVGLIAALERRGLIERRPHPSDGRAMGVHLTPAGVELTAQAEQTAAQLEEDATHRLTTAERKTLIRLLQKVYD